MNVWSNKSISNSFSLFNSDVNFFKFKEFSYLVLFGLLLENSLESLYLGVNKYSSSLSNLFFFFFFEIALGDLLVC